MIHTIVKPNHYMDSIFLMKAGKALGDIEGINKAVVVMGTDMNKTVLSEFGAAGEVIDCAGPNDLIVAVDSEEDMGREVEDCLEVLLQSRKNKSVSGEEKKYVSIERALDSHGGINLAVISLPGELAAYEGIKALQQGLNVFMFSDNVSIEDEIEMKRLGREKGLLVMGPGAGTAIIDNISVGLMSKVRKGRIGIVAASGSGLQEVAMLVHNQGEGISQGIGTGGRDLSREVGGSTMLAGIRFFKDDPETEVLVLISKPPHPETTEKILKMVETMNKPCVVFFLGGERRENMGGNVCFAASLEEAADLAVALVRGKKLKTGDYFHKTRLELEPKAQDLAGKLKSPQKYLRGLFCGGTHSEEAVLILQEMIGNLHSNLNFGRVSLLKDCLFSEENSLVDMGDETFTVGKPHPVMDPSILNERLLQEGRDPETAVLLFDILLGYGIHPDPVGCISETLKEIRENAESQGREIVMIASICGTDLDPQNYQEQKEKLEKTGVHVLESNGRAAILSGLVVRGLL